MNGHNVMCFKAEQTKLATLTLLEENQCSNCFCYCDEPGDKSDRYFSLHAQTSNITANKYICTQLLCIVYGIWMDFWFEEIDGDCVHTKKKRKEKKSD